MNPKIVTIKLTDKQRSKLRTLTGEEHTEVRFESHGSEDALAPRSAMAKKLAGRSPMAKKLAGRSSMAKKLAGRSAMAKKLSGRSALVKKI
jgi:hypothetical protein